MRIVFFADGKQTPWSPGATANDVAEEARARSELDARMCDFAIRVNAERSVLEQAAERAYHADINVDSASAERRLRAELKQVHSDLDLEWLPETTQFAIRAYGCRELYPLIDLLCERVGAQVAAARALASRGGSPFVVPRLPALGHAAALERASAALGREFSDSRVRVGFVRGHLLELAFAVPGCSGHQDAAALDAVNSYAEAALGEDVLDEWVGSIGVAPAPRGGPLRVLDSRQQGAEQAAPVAELSALVGRGISALSLGLPTQALTKDQAADWTLLDSSPIALPNGAYSDVRMDDALMAATRCPELLKCYLEGLPVSSRRFSTVGETFVYLKLPCSAPLPERPTLREAIEAQLELVLGDAAVLVGNAVGLHHIYIVLALRDLHVALGRLFPLSTSLRALIPRGSTLRFLDATWQLEWLRLG